LNTASGWLSMGCHGLIAIAHGLDDESGISGTQMHVLLRKRNGNSMLAEHLIDLQQQIMGSSRPILRTGHKTRDFPLQGMITKGPQEYCRGWCREYTRMTAHGLSKQALHEVQVAAVGLREPGKGYSVQQQCCDGHQSHCGDGGYCLCFVERRSANRTRPTRFLRLHVWTRRARLASVQKRTSQRNCRFFSLPPSRVRDPRGG